MSAYIIAKAINQDFLSMSTAIMCAVLFFVFIRTDLRELKNNQNTIKTVHNTTNKNITNNIQLVIANFPNAEAPAVIKSQSPDFKPDCSIIP
jgi:YbbR domain-containing protein